MKCYITNYHNKYLRADTDGTVNHTNNQTLWESWTIEQVNDAIYIKSYHETYLIAEPNRSVNLTTNYRRWERWTLEREDNYIYIKSHHGNYLRADENGMINLTTTRGKWERWNINAPELVYHEKMYTILEPDFLRRFIDTHIDKAKYNSIAKLFTVKQVYNPCNQRNALTCSFYGKDFNINTYKGGNWDKKYFTRLKKFIKDFNESYLFNSFKIRIYVENQLECFVEELLRLSSHVEIYYMEYNTDNNSQPGMLWRFLAFSDKSLDIAYCTDIDVDFNNHLIKQQHLQLFIKYNKTLGRKLCPINMYTSLDKLNKVSNNFAAVLGSRFGVRPNKLDLPYVPIKIDIKLLMIDYILYRDYRLTVHHSKEELDNYNTEPYSSWGGKWRDYGFDEKFLKHTLFPYLVRKGEVLSIVEENASRFIQNTDKIEYNYPIDIPCPIKVDIEFCKIYDNIFADGCF